MARRHINTYATIFFHRVGRNYAIYTCLGGDVNFNSFSGLLRSGLCIKTSGTVSFHAWDPWCKAPKVAFGSFLAILQSFHFRDTSSSPSQKQSLSGLARKASRSRSLSLVARTWCEWQTQGWFLWVASIGSGKP